MWQPGYDCLIQFLFIALPFLTSPEDGNAALRSVGQVIVVTELAYAYFGKWSYTKWLLNLHRVAKSLRKPLYKGVLTEVLQK